MIEFQVVTLFPEMIERAMASGVIGRGVADGLIRLRCIQLRDYATDGHGTVDDSPYGGGPGMVMKPEPLAAAVEGARSQGESGRVILMSPQGRPFTSELAQEFALERSLTIICGRYEGVDQRFIDQFVDDEVSVGDFVVTGGELPALMLMDAVSRFVPGVLGDLDSAHRDSFGPDSDGRLQGPVYTRPANFRGQSVPEVLLSGDHVAVERWRVERSTERTEERRPDLM